MFLGAPGPHPSPPINDVRRLTLLKQNYTFADKSGQEQPRALFIKISQLVMTTPLPATRCRS